MSNKRLLIQFSYLVSGTIFILTALAVFSNAGPLAITGFFLLGAWGINHYFVILKNRLEPGSHILTSLFLIFSILFACLTGGFYSPGILILFFIPVLTSLFSEQKSMALYNSAAVLFLCFLHLGPSWGPGVLNVNQYRFFYLVVVFMLYSGGMGLVIGQNRRDRTELEKSRTRLQHEP